MSDTTPQEELTLEQHIKFNILVPLVSDSILKWDRERGKLVKQDGSKRYNMAVSELTRLIERKVVEGKIEVLTEAHRSDGRGEGIDNTTDAYIDELIKRLQKEKI